MSFDKPKDSKKFITEMSTIKRSIKHLLTTYYDAELNIDLPHTSNNLQKYDVYEDVLEDFYKIVDKLDYLELPIKETGTLIFNEKTNSWYCGDYKIKENHSLEVLIKNSMNQNPYWAKTSLQYNYENDIWCLENLTVYGKDQISGLSARIRGREPIEKPSVLALPLNEFEKPTRISNNHVQQAMSKEMEDKFWEIYDIGYEKGDKSEKQKIEAIQKENYTLFRMSQKNPKKVMVIREPKLYDFEGAVWIIRQTHSDLEPTEYIELWGQDFWGKPKDEEW